MVQGYKNREIALRMGSTEQEVKNSLRKIFDKTGVFDRLELALFVLHHRTLMACPMAEPIRSRALVRIAAAQFSREWPTRPISHQLAQNDSCLLKQIDVVAAICIAPPSRTRHGDERRTLAFFLC